MSEWFSLAESAGEWFSSGRVVCMTVSPALVPVVGGQSVMEKSSLKRDETAS